jgi:hypothetical protein
VKGDFHAGICGSRGVRFPPATRPRVAGGPRSTPASTSSAIPFGDAEQRVDGGSS